MLLHEKDLEQYENKVVLDCGFFKDEKGESSILGMTPYYDLGEGFYGDYKEEKTTISDYKEKSIPFETDRDRLVFLRELYAKALNNAYPIFLRFGDEFLFINEFKFTKPQDSKEKMKELKRLMNRHVREDVLVYAETISYKLGLKNKMSVYKF